MKDGTVIRYFDGVKGCGSRNNGLLADKCPSVLRRPELKEYGTNFSYGLLPKSDALTADIFKISSFQQSTLDMEQWEFVRYVKHHRIFATLDAEM